MNTISTYRQNLKSKILTVASQEFTRRGVRAVKMDDIANALSISKRTLYEIYADKESLLLACIEKRHDEEDAFFRQFSGENSKSAIEIIALFFHRKLSDGLQVNPILYAEFKKYPAVLNYLEQRRQATQKEAGTFFEQGIREGSFMPDIEYTLLMETAEASTRYIMDAKLYERYSLEEIFRSVLLVTIRGFCTPDGVKRLDELTREYR